MKQKGGFKKDADTPKSHKPIEESEHKPTHQKAKARPQRRVPISESNSAGNSGLIDLYFFMLKAGKNGADL